MKHVVQRILEGEMQSGGGVLDFSCSKVEIQLSFGEEYEGTFQIIGPNGQLTEGYVYTNSLEMECMTREFSGSLSEIAFCFHGGSEKDISQGEFTIISNHGEYFLPWRVTVMQPEITSSLGTLKNLFHFTNLAKANWEEAVKLFYDNRFRGLLHGSDRQFYFLYRGLSGIYDSSREKEKNQQNMEEFLLAIKKKQPIEYLVSETGIRIEAPERLTEYHVTINRNGWGYTCLKVETEGDFLRVHKDIIREEDFLGNYYRLPYYIAGEQLHDGSNMGTIRLCGAYTQITISVTVLKRSGTKKKKGIRREQKHIMLELMEQYAAFRTKRISAAVWRKETSGLVDRMLSVDEGNLTAQLFRAQLLITEERFNEAGWILKRTGGLLEGQEEREPVLWCYHRYLTTLNSREAAYIDTATSQIEQIYAQNGDNWRIAWLLTYLWEERGKKPEGKWRLWEEQFKRGCTSPVIYLEALSLLQQNPSLLMKMEAFEIQVLLYAAKKEMIPKELIGQILYFVAKSKEYAAFLYQILQACYQVWPTDEVVGAICGLLIKGNRTGEACLPWYRLGIEREIRVTRLFEHYLLSIDLEKEEKLPKMVLMYFVYQNHMDERYQAYLYAYVHKNREEFPELYESFRETAERFCMRQMAQGRMNRWLAYLYRHCVSPEMITEGNADGLTKALFTVQIDILRAGIRQLIVLYDKGKTEQVWQITGRRILIPLYGNHFHIFLADGEGNRYTGKGNCQITKLIRPDKLAGFLIPIIRNNLGFDLWLCEKGEEFAAVTEANAEAMERLLQAAYLDTSYQKEALIRLIRYDHDRDRIDRLDRKLEELTPDQVEQKNYPEVLKLMLLRSCHRKAYQWLRTAGSTKPDAKLAIQILRHVMETEVVQEDRIMTLLSYAAFASGKYDEKLLQYLGRFYQGSIRQLRHIWKAFRDFELHTCELSERLLTQMLYSGSYVGERISIFKDFVAGGGRSDLEMAFLVQCAYEYFVQGKIIDVFLIRRIEGLLEEKEESALILELAFVKYFAENPEEIREETKVFLSGILKELIGRNVYFAFFKDYTGILPFMEQYLDKTIIEYRARPGNQAVIHYLLERDGKSGGEYIREEMKEMYGGIHARQFILFFGDRLSYYIAEKEEGEETFTESASISKSDIIGEQREGKFNQINDIEIACALGDYEAADSLLYEFYKRECMVGHLFQLK